MIVLTLRLALVAAWTWTSILHAPTTMRREPGGQTLHGSARAEACSHSPAAHRFYPGFNVGIGIGPVRAVGPWAGAHAALPLGPRQQYGFPQKVLWAVRRSRITALTMRGWNVVTRRAILFQFPDRPGRRGKEVERIGTIHSTDPFLVPAGAPNTIPWVGYGSTMYFPNLGCYILRVQWRGGGWTILFKAGT